MLSQHVVEPWLSLLMFEFLNMLDLLYFVVLKCDMAVTRRALFSPFILDLSCVSTLPPSTCISFPCR